MSQSTSRRKTEEKILDALRSQLISQGFRGLGVNAVARRAGVSKELIYRYFGGMDELIREVMKRQDYWSMGLARPVDRADAPLAQSREDQVADMLLNQLAQLRSQPELQEIRRWEMIDLNEITVDLASAREKASLDFLSQLDLPPGGDSAARMAILLSGVLYLVLRSKISPQWFGIDLGSDEGWDRIADAAKAMSEHTISDCGASAKNDDSSENNDGAGDVIRGRDATHTSKDGDG